MVSATLKIPDLLHRRIKSRAVCEGVFFRDYLITLLEKGLEQEKGNHL